MPTRGDISPFQSLMTALAATIGTGNIVGVATAMTLGGPGALFWMDFALFGLATKYSESVLSRFYREKNQNGEMSGGQCFPSKTVLQSNGLWYNSCRSFCCFCCDRFFFGIGNLTQINSIADAVKNTFSIPTWITGLVIAVLS